MASFVKTAGIVIALPFEDLVIPMLPEQFFKYAVAIGIAVVGLELVERLDPRLGTIYLIVVLLGVALSQREGVLKFTAFLQQVTQGG